jgi:hypothetical protein
MRPQSRGRRQSYQVYMSLAVLGSEQSDVPNNRGAARGAREGHQGVTLITDKWATSDHRFERM